VPPLLDAGGTGLVFATFAAFFVLGGLATRWLPERRGQSLEDVVPASAAVRT
jgi:MFS transporter, putative metabolite:H+ symporter